MQVYASGLPAWTWARALFRWQSNACPPRSQMHHCHRSSHSHPQATRAFFARVIQTKIIGRQISARGLVSSLCRRRSASPPFKAARRELPYHVPFYDTLTQSFPEKSFSSKSQKQGLPGHPSPAPGAARVSRRLTPIEQGPVAFNCNGDEKDELHTRTHGSRAGFLGVLLTHVAGVVIAGATLCEFSVQRVLCLSLCGSRIRAERGHNVSHCATMSEWDFCRVGDTRRGAPAGDVRAAGDATAACPRKLFCGLPANVACTALNALLPSRRFGWTTLRVWWRGYVGGGICGPRSPCHHWRGVHEGEQVVALPARLL